MLEAAAEAGLACIEWGADVHAPPAGDLRGLAEATAAAGLAVASYGTYWRATPDDDGVALIGAALALGCTRLRIWAGTTGSAEASRTQRADVVRRVQRLADEAAGHGLELAFEHHDLTLADTVESTLDLLAEVDRSNVGTYWQPRVGEPAEVALAGLGRLLPHVRAVHAFSWWPDLERLPLTGRADLWPAALEMLAATGRPTDVLLEFLPDDDLSLLPSEAGRLREWITQAT
ncbi:sugar phosphate isomerase/epimerase [Nocardioides sp. NBC_00850]|uniref:sugar phosphate isomerase/epimerase family protein n=1 Tax=Nocardioides sp. NBC_00850 TaxID=2976001 RepID=UPI00386BA439|nr:sugar phosphate isomerase/epimerase [Nocardioides sp. NBC_00850]